MSEGSKDSRIVSQHQESLISDSTIDCSPTHGALLRVTRRILCARPAAVTVLHAASLPDHALHARVFRPPPLTFRGHSTHADWPSLRRPASVSAAPVMSRTADQLSNWLEHACRNAAHAAGPIPPYPATQSSCHAPAASTWRTLSRQRCRRQVVEHYHAEHHACAGLEPGFGALLVTDSAIG